MCKRRILFIFFALFAIKSSEAMIGHKVIKKREMTKKRRNTIVNTIVTKRDYHNVPMRNRKPHNYNKAQILFEQSKNNKQYNNIMLRVNKENKTKKRARVLTLPKEHNQQQYSAEDETRDAEYTEQEVKDPEYEAFKKRVKAKAVHYLTILGYTLSISTGTFAIFDTVNEFKDYLFDKDNDYEYDALANGYEVALKKKLKEDSAFDLDKQCQEKIGMTFHQLEEFCDKEIGMSVRDIVIFAARKKLRGESMNSTVLFLQHKLQSNPETRKAFLKNASEILYPSVQKRAPQWCDKIGLVGLMTDSYSRSLYNYVVSPEFVEVVTKFEGMINQDIEKMKKVAYIGTGWGVTTVVGSELSWIISSLGKRGLERTALLIPGTFVPIYLGTKGIRYAVEAYKREGKSNEKYIRAALSFLKATYENYELSADFAEGLDRKDIMLNLVIDYGDYQLKNIKQNVKEQYLPLLQGAKEKAFGDKTGKERLLDIVSDQANKRMNQASEVYRYLVN